LNLHLAAINGSNRPENISKAYSILERVWTETKDTKYYARGWLPLELAPYAPDLALKLAAEKDGSVSDFTLASAISIHAESNGRIPANGPQDRSMRIKGPQQKAIRRHVSGLACLQTASGACQRAAG